MDSSPEKCEELLTLFINKVSGIRMHFPPPAQDTAMSFKTTAIFESFDAISIDTLTEVINKMKPSSCALNILPVRFLKEVSII